MNSEKLDYTPSPDSPKTDPTSPSVKSLSNMPLRKAPSKQNQNMPGIILLMEAISWIVSFLVAVQAAVWVNSPSPLENLMSIVLMLALHRPVSSLLQATYVITSRVIRSLANLAMPKQDVYSTISNKMELPAMPSMLGSPVEKK